MKTKKRLIKDAKEKKLASEDIVRIQASVRFWEIAYS